MKEPLPFCLADVFHVLFEHGVHYTLAEYPELQPLRLLMAKILWTERRLAASEEATEALANELATIEDRLIAKIVSQNAMQGGIRPTLLEQTFPAAPWITLRWPWPSSRASIRIRRTCHSITSGFSWRWVVVANAATVIWRKS